MKQGLILIVVAVLALAAGAWFGGRSEKAAHSVPAPTADAPTRLQNLTLPDLNGTPQPLGQWAGTLRVVNFWATWCSPCREEMPILSRIAQRYGTQVKVIGIGLDTPEAMRDFLTHTPVPYPLLVGEGSVIELTAQLGNQAMALPYTVILDARGQIIWQHVGKVEEARLNALLEQAIRPPRPG